MAQKQQASASATALAALFSGLDRAHGIYELPSATVNNGAHKVEGRAKTVKEPVTPALWQSHLTGLNGLGIVPIRDDGNCLFAALDIDQYAPDLLTKVERQCAELNLPLLPTRTKSGGAHLYLFGAEPLPATLIRTRLEEWAIALGHGGCEIFPKQTSIAGEGDVGNWINMPYYGALSGKTDRYGIFKGQPLSLEQYIARATVLRVTAKQLEALLIAPDDGSFTNGPPCLQSLGRIGFPMGARNNGLFAVAVYLKKRFPDDWKNQLVQYNQRYMRPPLPDKEVNDCIKGVSRKKYTYACDENPIKAHCNRALCMTREFGIGRDLADWGIVIDPDIQRINTDPPYWLLKINGQRLRFYADDLMNQRSFQEICMNKLSFWPGMLPPAQWKTEVNKIMANATHVDAPADASAGGDLSNLLEYFCTVFPQAETREEMLTGKPFTEDGVTMFRSHDFKKFLENQHFRSIPFKEIYAYLREEGIGHKQISIGNRATNVWTVKAYDRPPTVIPTRTHKPGSGEM